MMKRNFVIIAMVAVIGLLLISCGGDSGCSHDYSSGSVTTRATCVSTGVLTKTCYKCDNKITEVIPIDAEKGHDWKHTGKVTNQETCTETGIGEATCELCDKKENNHVFPATGHDLNWEITTAATCLDDAIETGTCKNGDCTETDTRDSTTSLATGHDYDNWTVTTTAKCLEAAIETGTCKNGDCTETDTRDSTTSLATGHDHTSSLVCKNTPCTHQYAMGDQGPGSGIIFYVADGQGGRQSSISVQAGTGFTAYTAYYLEAAPNNSSTSAQWGAYGTTISGVTTFTSNIDANASLIGNGRKDTQVIVTHLGTAETGRAAQLTSSANFGGKNDWFLPSLGELNQLYLQRNLTGIGIISGNFWASSQGSNTGAWLQGFNNGVSQNPNKNNEVNVRAIRAF